MRVKTNVKDYYDKEDREFEVNKQTFTAKISVGGDQYFTSFEDGFFFDKESLFLVIKDVYHPVMFLRDKEDLDSPGEFIDVMVCNKINLIVSKYSTYVVENFSEAEFNVAVDGFRF